MKLKKLLAALLSVTMCFTLVCASASATTTGELTGVIHDILDTSVTPRAATPPTSFFNLGGNNRYTVSFYDLSADRGVYTNRYFATSTGSIYVILNLQRSGTTQDTFRRLDIILYEKATATSPGVQVHMVNQIFVSAESIGRAYFHDLDPNKFYYILFRNESDDSYLSSKAISCSSGTIDDTL